MRNRSILTAIPIDKLADPSVGARIKFHRKRLAFTQMEVGRRAKLSQSLVSKIEKKPADATVGQLRAICGALKISLFNLVDDIPVVIEPSEETFANTRIKEARQMVLEIGCHKS